MIIIFVYFFLILIQGALTPTSTPVITPSTTGSTNTSYAFSLSSSTQSLTVSSYLILQFPSQYSIATVSNCSLSINGNVNTSQCTAGGSNQIRFSNIIASAISLSNLNVSFNSNGAIHAGTMNIGMYFADSGGNITGASGNISVTISAAIMSSCLASSSSNMVGSQSVWSLSFIPTVALNTTNFLRVTFGLRLNNVSNFLNTSNITCSKGACSYSTSQSSQLLNVSNFFTSTTLTNQSLDVSTVKNPQSTYPITIIYQVMYNNQYQIQRCSALLAVTKPSDVMGMSLSPSLSTSISSVNSNIQINLVQSVSLPSTGYYLITTPLVVSYSPANIAGTLPNATSVANGLLIGNLSTSIIQNFYNLSSFTITNPPSTKSAPFTITSLVIVNSVQYSVSETTLMISPSASQIVSSEASFAPKNANKIASYSISFKIINNLISGSYVIVNFPSQITLNDNSSCVTSVGTCTTNTASQLINITLSSALAAASNISVSITNVLNPYTTLATSSFKIATYYNSLDSLVDNLLSGLTLKAEPNTFQLATLNISNPQVGALSAYQFQIKFANTPLSGSILIIVFPVILNISNAISNVCNYQVNGTAMILSNCFSSSVTSLKITISNVRNPSSTNQYNIANISLLYNGSVIEYLSSSLAVKMNILASLSSSISLSNSTVNANSTYKFTVTFTQSHSTNDILAITVPTTSAILINTVCSRISGLSSMTCSYSSPNITIQLGFDTFPSNKTIEFSISTFTNNWFVSNASFLIVSSSNGFQMESGTATVQYTVGALSVTVSNDQNIVLLSNSIITFSIIPPFTINQSVTITIGLPMSDLNASSCNATNNANCVITNNILTISNINGFPSSLVISVTAATGYFATTSAFPVILYYNSNQIASNNNVNVSVFCNSPCKQCQSTNKSSCRSCLSSEYTALIYLVPSTQTCLSQCPSSTYLSDITCLACSSNCFNCSGTSTHCTSCKTGTYFFNNSCPGSCPDGTYPNSNICQNCNPSCQTCSSLSQCTSCPTNRYLFNSTCLSQCPNSYYSDVTNTCQSCGLCQTCVSPTNCSSCKDKYYLLNFRCYESCPSTYPIPSQGTCLPCDNTCQTCQNSTTFCLSCKNGTYLYNNKCLQSCPETLTANSLTNRCESVEKSMIYFPGLISSSVLAVIVVFSRIFFKSTSIPTSLVGLFAYPQFITYCYYLYLVALQKRMTQLAIAISGLIALLILSIAFVIVCIKKIHLTDEYYKHWYNSHKAVSWIFNILSCLNYKAYRLTYSKLFNLQALSSCFKNSIRILYLSTGITISGTILVEIVMSISCVTTLYLSTIKNQLFFQAVDTIVISGIIALTSIIDIPKTDEYFLNSPFLSNRVHVLDGKNNLVDQIDDFGANRLEQHQSVYGKGNRSYYKMQTGCFDGSLDKIRLGEDSIAESLNTGIIQFQSETLKNLNEKQKQSEVNQDQSHQKQQTVRDNVLPEDDQLIQKLKQLDQKQISEHFDGLGSFKSIKSSKQHSNKSKASEKQKPKSEQYLSQEQISQVKSIRKKKVNIFDPIQEQTEEELLNQLQSLRQSEDLFGGSVYRRPKSHSGKKQQTTPKSNQKYNRSTISVFNNKQLKQKWNNIIKSRIQNVKQRTQGLKPIPIIAINQMSQTQSKKQVFKRRKLRKPKKQYHNKQLEEIYLQRIAPVKNARSASAKHTSFRSSKYKL